MSGRAVTFIKRLKQGEARQQARGVALEGNPQRLVHIAAYNPSDYYVELEAAPDVGSDLPYKNVGTFRSLDRTTSRNHPGSEFAGNRGFCERHWISLDARRSQG
jgi:hypothetical protein